MKLRRNPPIAWVNERPNWCTTSRKLRVVTDPESPEYGRAAGFLSPAEGSVVYANDPSGRLRAPGLGPTQGRSFHAGEWDYTQPDGQLVSVKVGSICVNGGHSDSIPELAVPPFNTEKMLAARDYLQRAGRWQDEHGDLVLHGRVTEVPGEGVLFLGAAYEWAEPRDLDVINATTVSPEFWGHPDYGGQRDFLGAARVLRTALSAPDYETAPIAANENPGFTVFVRDQPMLAEEHTVDLSGIHEEIERMREELDGRINDLEAALFEHAATQIGIEALTLDDQVRALAEQVARLSEQLEQSATSKPPIVEPITNPVVP